MLQLQRCRILNSENMAKTMVGLIGNWKEAKPQVISRILNTFAN